jgi:hypothetical protein
VRPAETLAQVHAADAGAREVTRSLLGKASAARG